MCYRTQQEEFEAKVLSKVATKSSNSKGRVVKEEECDMRTAFQRDRDRILHCKSFRRLAHKTQVFISPEGDHYRTRLTHTLEVAQIARTIARALRLNEDLTEAIALGHDLGHTPFGHTGERALQELTKNKFLHNEHSLRVVEILENDGKGLNLTFEVKDGILNHPTRGNPATLEGKVVQLSDKIAYINHDIDDAIRGKVLREEDLPQDCIKVLGNTSSERITTIISDIVSISMDNDFVVMSPQIKDAFYSMRQFLFKNVYIGSVAKTEESKAQHIISELYRYYIDDLTKLPNAYNNRYELGDSKEQVVCDYIAGMTDRYAVHTYMDLFFPKSWNIY